MHKSRPRLSDLYQFIFIYFDFIITILGKDDRKKKELDQKVFYVFCQVEVYSNNQQKYTELNAPKLGTCYTVWPTRMAMGTSYFEKAAVAVAVPVVTLKLLRF